MWIFEQTIDGKYKIGYYKIESRFNSFGNYTDNLFVNIITVDTLLEAIRLVNYLNGGDGTINCMIEDICGE